MSKEAMSVYRVMGAKNYSHSERQENDYYATDPKAVEELLKRERFSNLILEPAVGGGHISNVLKEYGYKVTEADLIDRGQPIVADFFKAPLNLSDIVTNPPYKYAKEFIEHALEFSAQGCKMAFFLKVTFLEGKARKAFFKKYPPKKIWVFSERVMCAKNGDFEALKKSGGSAIAYAWFIWEKGYQGETVVDWI